MQALLSSQHNIVGITEDAPRVAPSKIKKIIKDIISKFNPNSRNLLQLCENKNVPYFFLTKSQDRYESWVRSKSPDLIVVYSMSHLLKENIISIPKYGVINMHPSLLPIYRGPNPLFWMYYNMEKKGGITIHYIDKGEDTGEIIFQESYDIPLGSNGPDLIHKVIITIGIPLLLDAIASIEKGNAPRIFQPAKSPTLRASNISPEEQKNFIDWEKWYVERIWHLLRGYANSMDLIEPPRGFYYGQMWQVGQYEKCDTSKLKKGIVQQCSTGYFIAGSDGIIQLSIRYRLKDMVSFLLSKL